MRLKTIFVWIGFVSQMAHFCAFGRFHSNWLTFVNCIFRLKTLYLFSVQTYHIRLIVNMMLVYIIVKTVIRSDFIICKVCKVVARWLNG